MGGASPFGEAMVEELLPDSFLKRAFGLFFNTLVVGGKVAAGRLAVFVLSALKMALCLVMVESFTVEMQRWWRCVRGGWGASQALPARKQVLFSACVRNHTMAATVYAGEWARGWRRPVSRGFITQDTAAHAARLAV